MSTNIILIVSAVFSPEPIVSAQISQSLAHSLAAANNQVSVVAPYPSRPAGFNFNIKNERKKYYTKNINKNLCIQRLPSFVYSGANPMGRLWESISFGYASYRYIIKHADKISRVYMNTWPLFGQIGVALACKKINVPYVIHIQDIYPESFTNKLSFPLKPFIYTLLFPIEKYILKNAHKIITISIGMNNHLMKTRKISSDKFQIINNWQDEKEFTSLPEFKAKNNKFTFMYLGNIGPVAGVPLLMNAFATAQLENAKLVIAGSGSKLAECIALATRFPQTNIEFIEVPAGKVAETQSKADVLLLPLIKGAATSSIPSKLSAYMFSKKPIIALADKGSDIDYVINKANCGWIGPPEDINWLIGKYKEVCILDKHLLQRKGECGFQFAVDFFSKENNLKKLVKAVID